MTFSCRDRPGVSSMMKNDKFLMKCDRFVDNGWNRGTRWNTTEKDSDFDENLMKLGLGFSRTHCIMILYDNKTDNAICSKLKNLSKLYMFISKLYMKLYTFFALPAGQPGVCDIHEIKKSLRYIHILYGIFIQYMQIIYNRVHLWISRNVKKYNGF